MGKVSKMRFRLADVGATAVVAGFAAALWAIPLLGSATVCVDDFIWITMARAKPTFPEAIIASWNAYMFFRPIDVIANWFVDPVTLGIAPILPFQFAGLGALTAGVWRLQRLLGVAAWLPRLAATAWLWLHPATQVSLWAAGATSQTWCAAAGVWLMTMVLAEPSPRSSATSRIVSYALVSSLGIVCKELFVGWATAAAATFLLLQWTRWTRPARRVTPATVMTVLPSLAAILAPPALWVGMRLLAPTFGGIVLHDTGHHYSLHGPKTVAMNIGLTLLGLFVQGPVHWARLLPFPWASAPFLGAALSLSWAAYGARHVSNVRLASLPGGALAWSVAMGLLAVWPAFGIDHVSEVYLMGPNALVAALVGIGVGASFAKRENSQGSPHVTSWQSGLFADGGALLLAIVTITGFVSRTAHYAVTWNHARTLRHAVDEIVDNCQSMDGVTVIVPEALMKGPTHCKYIVPPNWAADVASSTRVRSTCDTRYSQVKFVIRKEAALEPGGPSAILSPALRARPAW